jgi:hypothetical protein
MSRGRNRALIEKRDRKLLIRYHYWTEVERLRFDDVLRVLSQEEFFISEERIMKIIRENNDILTLMTRQSPTAKKSRSLPAQLTLFKGE